LSDVFLSTRKSCPFITHDACFGAVRIKIEVDVITSGCTEKDGRFRTICAGGCPGCVQEGMLDTAASWFQEASCTSSETHQQGGSLKRSASYRNTAWLEFLRRRHAVEKAYSPMETGDEPHSWYGQRHGQRDSDWMATRVLALDWRQTGGQNLLWAFVDLDPCLFHRAIPVVAVAFGFLGPRLHCWPETTKTLC